MEAGFFFETLEKFYRTTPHHIEKVGTLHCLHIHTENGFVGGRTEMWWNRHARKEDKPKCRTEAEWLRCLRWFRKSESQTGLHFTLFATRYLLPNSSGKSIIDLSNIYPTGHVYCHEYLREGSFPLPLHPPPQYHPLRKSYWKKKLPCAVQKLKSSVWEYEWQINVKDLNLCSVDPLTRCKSKFFFNSLISNRNYSDSIS
jgi:hypothetical protein